MFDFYDKEWFVDIVCHLGKTYQLYLLKPTTIPHFTTLQHYSPVVDMTGIQSDLEASVMLGALGNAEYPFTAIALRSTSGQEWSST